MPRGKNSKTASAVSKTAGKITAEPIKEAATAEKASMKSSAGKKKSATAKAAATKSAAKTTAVKKTTTTVKAVEKDTKKAATESKKPVVRKTAKEKSDEVVFQSGGKDYTLAEITQLCKDAYRGGTRKQVKSIKVYIKAEKSKLKAYYVVNDSINGSVDL